jgi:hypothetical protein
MARHNGDRTYRRHDRLGVAAECGVCHAIPQRACINPTLACLSWGRALDSMVVSLELTTPAALDAAVPD